jgi:hypothetical protein
MDVFEDFSPIEWDQSDMEVLAEVRHYCRMPSDFGTFELFTAAGEPDNLLHNSSSGEEDLDNLNFLSERGFRINTVVKSPAQI